MNFAIKIITPQEAKMMLQTMGNNRRINDNRVRIYANDMINNRWTLSPQPICFDEDGRLTDGQHRLSAIIRTGVSVEMVIAYNVPHDCILDKGLERNQGDALYMRGFISKAMAARDAQGIVNRYFEIKYGSSKAKAMSDTAKIGFIQNNETNIAKAISLSRKGSHRAICKRSGIQTAIFAALTKDVPEEILHTFTSVANTGFAENKNQSSAIVLRNYVIQTPSSGSTEANHLCLITEMAIRDFVGGVCRKQIYKGDTHVYIDKE